MLSHSSWCSTQPFFTELQCSAILVNSIIPHYNNTESFIVIVNFIPCYNELNHFATVLTHFMILSVILEILLVILLQC
jgi:hypothetical protein